MARIEGFRVRNYKVLKDVTLGRYSIEATDQPLTPMTAVIGKNGTGKSALFDAFGFLSDALRGGVEEACDAHGRGGFDKIKSQGKADHIRFDLLYRENEESLPIRYLAIIGPDPDSGRPSVRAELMSEGEHNSQRFLMLASGIGTVWKGFKVGEEVDDDAERLDVIEKVKEADGNDRKNRVSEDTEFVELDDPRKLGIATLGTLKQHPRISAFRRFMEGWHLSYFTPNAARSLPLAGPQQHLNTVGDNLGNVVQYMEREHPKRFKSILKRIADKIPGIDRIDTERTSDGRLLLRFNDKGFQDPFYAQQVSDGTLKVFAYLLLLEDPTPPPFICIEEPENGLYHKLLETLANEFREHAIRRKNGSQVFVTTHQPYFVDALDPHEVWILDKGADGFSTIQRASDDPIVKNMVEEGLPLGGLWYSDYLDAR